MERCKVITHRGKDIVFMDFTKLSTLSEIEAVITEGIRLIRTQPEGSVFTITDITDMYFNTEISEAFKSFTHGNKPYVKAGAVIGVTGLKRIMYNGIMKFSGRDLSVFDDVPSAKDWLARK